MHKTFAVYFILFRILIVPLSFGRSVGTHNILNQFSRFAKDMKVLLVDKVYVINVCGIFLILFTSSGVILWGKNNLMLYEFFNFDQIFSYQNLLLDISKTIYRKYDCFLIKFIVAKLVFITYAITLAREELLYLDFVLQVT